MKKLKNITVWAHRGGGAASRFKENSLEAIEYALENGFEKLELDVWLRGESLILSHDKPTEDDHTLLSKALELIDGKAQIYLDIKQVEAALAVHELVKKEYVVHYDTVVFASFELEVLRKLRAKSAAACLGLNYRGVDDHFIDIVQELNVKYVAFNWKRVIPNYFNIKQSRQILDIKYLAYTVNTPHLARLMQRLGINGIITDYPSRF